MIAVDEAAWKRLADRMSYIEGDITNLNCMKPSALRLLPQKEEHGTEGNVIFPSRGRGPLLRRGG